MINDYVADGFFSPENPTIPTAYADGYSYKEQVGKLITYVNSLYKEYQDLFQSNTTLNNNYASIIAQMSEYEKQLDNFIKGYTIADGSVTFAKLSSDIIDTLQNFCVDIIHNYAKFVWFGLNDDGYFVAIIPNTWSEINFTTDTDGRLVLEY